ncbi:hypothetical protein Q5P01_000434 [Channa striata]|uniref:Peptidase S1 domain-containing protein n=1 Tax=Channa striata TaxID=64152 RepID=A0AA88IIP8_CHASR|nr:hypothetical protein Q5P01_000434 [Channa striata]
MASLQKDGRHVCSGTLVDEDSVLSSADCVSSSPTASDWTVVLGRLKQNGSNPFEVTLNVTDITLSNQTGSNAAVLHLETTPTLSNYIQPICVERRTNLQRGLDVLGCRLELRGRRGGTSSAGDPDLGGGL